MTTERSGPKMEPPASTNGSGVGASRAPIAAADIADSPRQSLVGRQIGRYRLLSPIAVGGMAQVWAAKPEGAGLSRTVAIKLVRPELAADEEYSRMFIDEAMVASSIHHPNVCEIHELGREGDVLFMVLEWVPGVALSRVLQIENEVRPLPEKMAARIVADACAGLHSAHEAVGPDGQLLGIVHRDVSPPNLLLSIHGHVKVSDFGIAKARHQLHTRTRTGEIKGKFAYIPPEQILGRGIDRRTDIYALGCVLYVATLGLRPFGSGVSALRRIAHGTYPRPRELRKDYSEGLEAIVVKALSPDQNDRYPTAAAMQMALEQWLLHAGEPVLSSDIAAVVRERIGPSELKVFESLLSVTQQPSHELAFNLLRSNDKADTPTADRSLTAPEPMGSRRSTQPGIISDATVRVPVFDGSQPPGTDRTVAVRPHVEVILGPKSAKPTTPAARSHVEPEARPRGPRPWIVWATIALIVLIAVLYATLR